MKAQKTVFGKKDGFKNETYIIIPTETFSAYASHPLVRAAYLTDVGFFPHASSHFVDRPQGTDAYILIYCTGGSGSVEANGKTFLLGHSDAFCIPVGMPHRYYASSADPWSILWVHFKGENMKFFPLNDCRIIHMGSHSSDNRMQFLFGLLFRVLEHNYTLGNFIYISNVLSTILSELYFREKRAESTTQNRHVTQMVRFMYANLTRNLTLDEIAGEVRLSRSYLNSIFKTYTKRAPMDFFLHLKMQEACKILKSGEIRVYEAAQKLGYSDPYYFSRIFRKIIGISPKEYQNGSDVYLAEEPYNNP